MSLSKMENNFEIICKPVQIGKTFQCIELIKERINNDTTDGRSVHFIFTQNTTLNQNQFFERLPSDKVVTFGTIKKSKNHINNKLELEASLLLNGKNTVVMCSNAKRFNDIMAFCGKYNEGHDQCRRIFIYIDEIHEYITLCKNFLETLRNYIVVKKITGLTATPGPLFSFFDYIKLADYSCSNYINYQSLSQHIFIHPEIESTTHAEYVEKVLENYHDDFYTNGKRSFIPSNVKISTHIEMKDLIVRKSKGKDMIVLLINSRNKSFYYISKGVEKIVETQSSNSPICDNISKFIEKYRLKNVPFFITGHRCIKVGITICNSNIGAFTSSIISNHTISSNNRDFCKYEANLYQLIGRTTGNVKEYEGFYNTKIFCPSDVKDIVLPMESRATQLDIRAKYETELINKEKYIGNNIIETNSNKVENYDIDYRIFENDDGANKFIKDNKMSNRPQKCGLNKEFTNKSIQDILNRKWGFGNNKYRKIKIHYDETIHNKIDDGKILVYWKKDSYDNIE